MFLWVFFICLNGYLAFSCKPSDCGKYFFILQFGDLFELFSAKLFSLGKSIPNKAGIRTDFFYSHNFRFNYKNCI